MWGNIFIELLGVRPLDELINPTKRDWVTELYGDPGALLLLAHNILVYRSLFGEVYAVLNLEFGGVDTLYLVKICRIFDCDLSKIYISRAFRSQDTVEILKSLENVRDSTIVLIFPYNYLPQDPAKYHEATRITGIISRISLSNTVILLNTITRFGSRNPEGGSLHHHLVKIILRIAERGEWLIAELIKHPVKSLGEKRIFSKKILSNPLPTTKQRTILEWVANRVREAK